MTVFINLLLSGLVASIVFSTVVVLGMMWANGAEINEHSK